MTASEYRNNDVPCRCARDGLDYSIQALGHFFLQHTFSHSKWMKVLTQRADIIDAVEVEPQVLAHVRQPGQWIQVVSQYVR